MCDPFQKLTSSRAVWMWNASYQALYNKTKALIKDDVCMRFYDETKPLYLKVEASGIGLGTIPRPIAFASKSLTQCRVKVWQH